MVIVKASTFGNKHRSIVFEVKPPANTRSIRIKSIKLTASFSTVSYHSNYVALLMRRQDLNSNPSTPNGFAVVIYRIPPGSYVTPEYPDDSLIYLNLKKLNNSPIGIGFTSKNYVGYTKNKIIMTLGHMTSSNEVMAIPISFGFTPSPSGVPFTSDLYSYAFGKSGIMELLGIPTASVQANMYTTLLDLMGDVHEDGSRDDNARVYSVQDEAPFLSAVREYLSTNYDQEYDESATLMDIFDQALIGYNELVDGTPVWREPQLKGGVLQSMRPIDLLPSRYLRLLWAATENIDGEKNLIPAEDKKSVLVGPLDILEYMPSRLFIPGVELTIKTNALLSIESYPEDRSIWLYLDTESDSYGINDGTGGSLDIEAII